MKKVLNIEEAIRIAKKIKSDGKKIVLVGGIFDILHVGHIKYLENSKKAGDILFVLLESDKLVRETKGKNRPINTQKDRAELLSSLSSVDFVIPLSGTLKNKDYDRIVGQILPDVLAVTKNDPNIIHKVRQAKLTGAKVKIVLQRIKSKSTTRIANELEAELEI